MVIIYEFHVYVEFFQRVQMCAFSMESHDFHGTIHAAECVSMFCQVLGEFRLLGVVLERPQMFFISRMKITTCLADVRSLTIGAC